MPMTPVQGSAVAATRWLPLLLLGILVAASVLGLWWYDRNATTQGSTPTAVPKSEPPAVAAAPTKLESAQQPSSTRPVQTEVLQQQWQVNGRFLQLRLQLNQAPLRRVETSTEQQLTLTLESVVLAPALKQQLPKPPSQIASAEWLSAGAGLTLKLSSTQAARFSVVGGDQTEGHLLLVKIELLPQQARRPANPDSADSVVMPTAPLAINKTEAVAAIPGTDAKPKAKQKAVTQPARQNSKPIAPVKEQPGSKAAAVSGQSSNLNKMVKQSPQQLDRSMAIKMTRLVNSRQLTQAKLQLRDYIATHSVSSESRTLLATLQIGSQQIAQAQQLIEEGLELDQYHPGLRKLKARLLLQQSQLSVAIELLSQQPPALTADPEYHQILAASQQAAGQYQQAAEIYHRLLRLRSDEPAWWIGLALSLESMQQTQQARQAYQNVLKIPGLSPALSDYAGQRLSRLGG